MRTQVSREPNTSSKIISEICRQKPEDDQARLISRHFRDMAELDCWSVEVTDQGGEMALRWAAAAFVETEKSYRKIMGHAQLWMLKAHLTPEEAWQGIEPQKPIPIRACEELRPMIGVTRSSFQGDPRLPVVQIDVDLAA